MEEEKRKQEMTETDAREDLNTVEGRRGPTWRGWVLSILVAVILSVTATLILGGPGAFLSDRAVAGSGGSGCGGRCCPPVDGGK